jgi:hypothetical protein
MFLGSYDFDGDPAALLAAYDELMRGQPAAAVQLHVCVEREGGITVFDACPSQAVFEQFSRSEQFLSAAEAAGLPSPRVTPLGDVHHYVAATEAAR